jgi:hypothetical protein
MSNWRERLRNIVRRKWFRAEVDEIGDTVTLTLIAVRVALVA